MRTKRVLGFGSVVEPDGESHETLLFEITTISHRVPQNQ